MDNLVERLREQARYEARANNSIKYPPGTQRPEDCQAWKDAEEIERLLNEIAELRESLKWALPLVELTLENCRQERLKLGHNDIGAGTDHLGLWEFEVAARDRVRAITDQ